MSDEISQKKKQARSAEKAWTYKPVPGAKVGNTLLNRIKLLISTVTSVRGDDVHLVTITCTGVIDDAVQLAILRVHILQQGFPIAMLAHIALVKTATKLFRSCAANFMPELGDDYLSTLFNELLRCPLTQAPTTACDNSYLSRQALPQRRCGLRDASTEDGPL